MDVISEAVATTRAGRAVAVRNRYAGSWSRSFPEINGTGLHLVRRGAPWLVPEDGRPIPLGPGGIVFVPHGRPHGFRNAPHEPEASQDVEFVSCCYHLDRGRVHESLSGLPDVITMVLDDDRHPALRPLTELLCQHAADTRPGSDLALPAVVDLLLIHLLRMWHDGTGAAAGPVVADQRIARALRMVNQEPFRPWTVRQLSEVSHMSPSAFARGFTAAIGERPGAYLLRRRLDHGAHLLRRTDLPLGAIAQRLGYATEFSFAAAFRREFGIAPGRFRGRERASARDRAGSGGEVAGEV